MSTRAASALCVLISTIALSACASAPKPPTEAEDLTEPAPEAQELALDESLFETCSGTRESGFLSYECEDFVFVTGSSDAPGNDKLTLSQYLEIMLNSFMEDGGTVVSRTDLQGIGDPGGVAEEVTYTLDGETMKAGLFVDRPTPTSVDFMLCSSINEDLSKCKRVLQFTRENGPPQSVAVEDLRVQSVDFVGNVVQLPEQCTLEEEQRISCTDGTSVVWWSDVENLGEYEANFFKGFEGQLGAKPKSIEQRRCYVDSQSTGCFVRSYVHAKTGLDLFAVSARVVLRDRPVQIICAGSSDSSTFDFARCSPLLNVEP